MNVRVVKEATAWNAVETLVRALQKRQVSFTITYRSAVTRGDCVVEISKVGSPAQRLSFSGAYLPSVLEAAYNWALFGEFPR